MRNDVVDLRDFYASTLGQTARRLIRQRLAEMWPDVEGQRVLGLGYAAPYLRAWHGSAERVIAMMPAAQGVLHWPTGEPNLTALADDLALPLPDLSIDRVLLVHALEHAEPVRPFLREIWRVMSGAGRLIAVVPNRRGLWARFERTPFGHGHPYTRGQITRLLREHMFTPTAMRSALFVPPAASRLWLRMAGPWERVGERWLDRFAGVVLIEAGKQLYVPTAVRATSAAPVRQASALPGAAREAGRSRLHMTFAGTERSTGIGAGRPAPPLHRCASPADRKSDWGATD